MLTKVIVLSLFLLSIVIATECSPPEDWDPNSPLDILCCQLPEHFYHCILEEDQCDDWMNSYTEKPIQGVATCYLSSDVPCSGPRTWTRKAPCIRTNGKRYPSLLFLSALGGIFGADRFYLNQYGIAVLKLLSVGGLGFWWLVDIIIVINGQMCPNANCVWESVFDCSGSLLCFTSLFDFGKLVHGFVCVTWLVWSRL
ncbi:hypothetical protein GEMRC1_008473 [Eukaryota sp. GEM-RC1]